MDCLKGSRSSSTATSRPRAAPARPHGLPRAPVRRPTPRAFNVYGQRRVTSVGGGARPPSRSPRPTSLRGGLFFQGRFRIEAVEELENATLVLDSGWLEDITLNTLAPAPVGEASRDGKIVLELGRVPAGDEHILYLHFQVNPTAVGVRSQDVELYDGERLIASFDRTAFVWP